MSEYVLTVSALSRYIKSILEEDSNLKRVYVKGEISNFTNHYKTGHFYFTLKDENAQIKAIMFKSANQRLRFMPENSMAVIARGYIGLYEKSGEYQLYVEDMQPDGAGALAVAFEQLKKKLAAEGLFDSERKKRIPKFPERVAVITSETGAAVRDIINVISRRYPPAEIILCPVSVQGEYAAGQISSALKLVNENKAADVIIVGRGGGSIEDLWAFNEEIVARAVFESEIPVISAVGHETDFTICDFVADLRAPTPSAAAELAVPDVAELVQGIKFRTKRMYQAASRNIDRKRFIVSGYTKRLESQNPRIRIDNMMIRLDSIVNSMDYAMKTRLSKEEQAIREFAVKLEATSPLKVLSRGYGMVSKNGNVIADADSLSKGDIIDIQLRNGSVKGQIL